MALAVLSLAASGWALSGLLRANRRWAAVLAACDGGNLESMLQTHLRERSEQQADLSKLLGRTTKLEDKMRSSKRFVGLVKYDAFDDVGGQQSFALAIYDDEGNGAVVSSIVGRSDCRVYCKPLLGGRSERGLSQEEQRAILDAVAEGPRAIISK